MIQITDKSKCCGCTACYSVCPKKCITMKPDEEGFLYPVVDVERCIACQICEKVCPYNTVTQEQRCETMYGAIQHISDEVRRNSTSGGAFTLIADYIIESGGMVFAVGYNGEMVVAHKKCSNKAEVESCRGSKYVQSTLYDTFDEVKKLLEMNTKVLFVGTPCQVHGLQSYIGNNELLYKIDLLCLGVSSPRLFRMWIDYLSAKYDSTVTNVEFRNKRYGYAVPNVRVYFANGKALEQRYDTKVYNALFFKHLNVRPSCYACDFREVPRVSDFTIGDFTRIAEADNKMDDDKGTSRIWIHTEKGKKLMDEVSAQTRFSVLNYDNSNIVGGPRKQIEYPKRREEFFEDACRMDYLSLVTRWNPKSIKSELASYLRPLLNKIPFKTVIFKYLRVRQANKYAKRVNQVNK